MALKGIEDASGDPYYAGRVAIGKGQDFALTFRIRSGDGHGKPIRVTLTGNALAADTSLNIKPDHPALASGDKLVLGEDAVLTLSGACAVGSPTLPVTAPGFALNQGDELQKVTDLTGYGIKAVVLPSRGDLAAASIIADTAFTVTLATQTGADRGRVTISALAAATASKDPGSYYGALWRRDSGSTRPLAEFSFKLEEAGEDGFA